MKETRIIMGMPVVIEVVDHGLSLDAFEAVFAYLVAVDERFSTYKPTSEISLFNEGKISRENLSTEMREVFTLSEKTKQETHGYFDIFRNGVCDPSGLVKGLAIHGAANILRAKGFKNFYVEIAGDIEVSGVNSEGTKWSIGIRNPFNRDEIVKVVYLTDKGVATSGTSIRGLHIYNPVDKKPADDIASITIIGSNVYEAVRFATAAFAMGHNGIVFIENLPGFEGYMIDHKGIATMTHGFAELTHA